MRFMGIGQYGRVNRRRLDRRQRAAHMDLYGLNMQYLSPTGNTSGNYNCGWGSWNYNCGWGSWNYNYGEAPGTTTVAEAPGTTTFVETSFIISLAVVQK